MDWQLHAQQSVPFLIIIELEGVRDGEHATARIILKDRVAVVVKDEDVLLARDGHFPSHIVAEDGPDDCGSSTGQSHGESFSVKGGCGAFAVLCNRNEEFGSDGPEYDGGV